MRESNVSGSQGCKAQFVLWTMVVIFAVVNQTALAATGRRVTHVSEFATGGQTHVIRYPGARKKVVALIREASTQAVHVIEPLWTGKQDMAFRVFVDVDAKGGTGAPDTQLRALR